MIDRESIIEKSVETYLRNQLYTVRHYPTDKVVMLDSYPTGERMMAPIDKNYIAIGWSADDGGRQAELGSSLKRRIYMMDFYIFGISRVWGKNIASVVRFCLETDGTINLLDPSDGSTILGYVDVDFVSSQQVIAANPRPWEENAYVTRLRVEDYYNSSMGG